MPDRAALQRIDHGVSVDDGSAARVDQHRAVLHLLCFRSRNERGKRAHIGAKHQVKTRDPTC